MAETQDDIEDELEYNSDDMEKFKAMFETRNEIPDDEATIREFTYANEEVDDPDGSWWLILGVLFFVWTLLGVVGAIKVIQWTILFLKNLLD